MQGTTAHQAIEAYDVETTGLGDDISIVEMPPAFQARFSELSPVQQEEFLELLRTTGMKFNEFIEAFRNANSTMQEFAETLGHFNRVFNPGADFDPRVHNQKNLDKAYLRHRKAVEKRKKRKRGGHK